MKHNVLTAREVERLIAAGVRDKHGDGSGLYLAVTAPGVASWLYRYTVDKNQTWLGLGSARVVSLALARELAREQREIRARGRDPLTEKRARRERARVEREKNVPFKRECEEFIEVHDPTWENDVHRGQWRGTMRNYVYPKIGSFPVHEIDGPTITEALAPIWLSKTVTAKRVKARIERVLSGSGRASRRHKS